MGHALPKDIIVKISREELYIYIYITLDIFTMTCLGSRLLDYTKQTHP